MLLETRLGWDNINIDGRGLIYSYGDSEKWLAYLNKVINLRVPYSRGSYSSYSTKSLLHSVSYVVIQVTQQRVYFIQLAMLLLRLHNKESTSFS